MRFSKRSTGSMRSVLALFIAIGSFALIPAATSAQTKTVSGTVRDQSGNPLTLVSVMVKGTGKGTTSDGEGHFILNAEPGGVLFFSLVDYETFSATVDRRNEYHIVLKQFHQQIDSVVVVGYGTSRKKDLTGSVASVALNEQEKTPVLGVEQLLEGRVSGVQVSQNQSQPGANFAIRIRGTNSINASSAPLFVVDGYAGGNAGGLNPSDILSIDVLKDASATAIYGSRGANGVVIITTKRGSAAASKVTIDAYTGVQRVGKQYKMMNATQYGNYLNTLQEYNNATFNTNTPIPYTQTQLNALGAGTDWQKQIFTGAPISNFSIAFNGGNSESRHYLSFNFFDQQGIIRGSDYKRGIVRYNSDQTISRKIKVGMSSQLSYSHQNLTTVNTQGGSTVASVLWDAVRFNPILPVRDTNGKYTYVNRGPSGLVSPLGNPVAYMNEAQQGIYNQMVFANVYGEYEIIKGLKLKTSFGANYNGNGQKTFLPTDLFVASGIGSAAQTSGRNYDWLNENTLTYNKEFNANNVLNLQGGFTFQHWYSQGFSAGITKLSTNLSGADNLGYGIPVSAGSGYDENTLASYFGRANYRLMEKYLFTFTMRADGSSRFGTNSKWGYFPSGAFAWRLSQEQFIKDIKAISDLKLRTSYGVTGNQEIGDYNSLSQLVNNQYSLGTTPSLVVGLSSSNIPNANLKWESTASSDIGLDMGLWNNRVYFTADYYYKKTSNLLLSINVPETSGYSKYLVNAGSVANKGFEFSATTVNIDRQKFKWNTTLNFSTNANKVLNLSTNKNIPVFGGVSASLFNGGVDYSSLLVPGKAIGTFYGYQFAGIWQSQDQIAKSGTKDPVHPGDPIYKDLDHDSTITATDRTFIGHALPKYIFGMTNNLSLGNFELNIFIQGVYGNQIFNENLYEIQNGDPTFNKLAYVGRDSWHGAGTSNGLPAIGSTLRRAVGVTSDVLENGSFVRLKSVTLSYNLPLYRVSNIFKTASIYITGQNLVTLTKYSGYDPEVNSFTDANPLSLGTDYNAYPNYRTYLVGVKFGF